MSAPMTAPPVLSSPADGTVLSAREATKSYGPTRALAGVDLDVGPGEVIGVIGHNGAGKSTLMRILAGIEPVDSGVVTVAESGPARRSGFAGVRMAYQETSLCADLTVAQNVYLSARDWMPSSRWRRTAAECAARKLDEIFPGHGVSPAHYVEDLTLAQRQMVEIARAATSNDLRLLILDEPTESLTSDASAKLYDYVRSIAASGVAVLLISHRMAEVLSVATRVLVLKDGAVAGDAPASEVTEQLLLDLMGSDVAIAHDAPTQDQRLSVHRGPVVASVSARSARTNEPSDITIHQGEVIGLAGIAGQGQQDVLAELWRPTGRRRSTAVTRRAFVPGDRQRSAIFPLWTVGDNLAATAMRSLARAGRRSLAAEKEVVGNWVGRLKIKGGPAALMTGLSGGNQQKVIVARAFASDAQLILLDDPFRGVDVHTKTDLYRLIRTEAEDGRTIVWFSSENAEMSHCDRVYVLRAGRVAAELQGAEITEERIIAESFAELGEVAA
jgi:ribose transport system ATP-binding protein